MGTSKLFIDVKLLLEKFLLSFAKVILMRISLLAFFSIVLLLASCKPTKKKNDFIYKKDSMMNKFIPVDWAHSTNIYEVNVRQYTEAGTFNAFMQHLPRLKAMGCKLFGLCPLHLFRKRIKRNLRKLLCLFGLYVHQSGVWNP